MKTLFQLLNIVVDPAKQDSTTEFLKQISNNTEVHFYETGWDNLYGRITIVIAAIALIVAIWTLVAQMHTERHTKNTPYKAQEGILRDLPRHFYRNLICTIAMIRLYEQKRKEHAEDNSKTLRYPSEANMLKLQTLPEEVLLKMDLDEKNCENTYKKMHETTLLFRNYNTEVQTASDHFKRADIDEESLLYDYDNLLFKPCFLTKGVKKLNDTFSGMDGYGAELDEKTIMSIIVAEHISKWETGKTPDKPSTKTLDGLISDDYLTYLGLPKVVKSQKENPEAKKDEPLMRSYKILFKKKPIEWEIDKDILLKKVKEILNEEEKYEQFENIIKQESKNSIYGSTLCKDTNIVNFWNLFKIMCYLDSRAEEKNIGMINVA